MKDENDKKYVRTFLGKVIDEGENELIYFVGPLIAALRNPACEDVAKELLDKMENKKLGKGDSETLKNLISIGTAAMRDENRKEYVRTFLEKVIDEGENELIYFVGPLIAVLQDPACEDVAKKLLNKMENKKLGKGDSETLKGLISVGTATMKNENRKEYVRTFLEKIIDEGENELIYFVGPLIAALKDPACGEITKKLLNKMENKKLGKGDSETIKKIERIFRGAIHNPKQRFYVETFMDKLKEEGNKININGNRYEGPTWNRRLTSNNHREKNMRMKNRY